MEVEVSCIFVERNTTFRCAYHFIRKCSVLHIYLTITVGNGRYLPKMLHRRVHGTGKEQENSSGFQGIQSGVFIKL